MNRLDVAGDGVHGDPGHHGEAGVESPSRGGGSRFAGGDHQLVVDAIEVGGPNACWLRRQGRSNMRGVVEPAAAVDEARRAAGSSKCSVMQRSATGWGCPSVPGHHRGVWFDLRRWRRISGRLDAVQPHRAGVGFGSVADIVAGLTTTSQVP